MAIFGVRSRKQTKNKQNVEEKFTAYNAILFVFLQQCDLVSIEINKFCASGVRDQNSQTMDSRMQ